MAINNSLSEKSSRKYTLSLIVYITIFLIISLLVIKYLPLKNSNNTQQNTEKSNICYIGNINDKIKEIVEEYSSNNNYKIDDKDCNITIARNIKDPNDYTKLFTNTYVLVQKYDGILENISSENILTILNTQKYNGYKVYWNNETDIFLKSRFDIGVGQQILNSNEIEKLVKEDNNSIAIIPINELNINYSVIDIDFQSPLSKEYNHNKYPLQDMYWIKGDKNGIKNISEYMLQKYIDINIDRNNLTSIILTGSSSIGAGELYRVTNNKNIKEILIGISNTLSQTDIVHINNEISYTENCIQSDISKNLCAVPSLINKEIFNELNIKVIGINGNHILDQGEGAFIKTLNKYKSSDIKYFGGGENTNDKNITQTININSNNISFYGYSYIYPFSYTLTDKKAGNHTAKIEDIKNTLSGNNNTINILDMSWGYEEKNELVDYQIEYTKELLKTNTDIIIGTNSLIPQKFEIIDNKLVGYNLGSFLPYNIQYIKDIGSVIVKVYIYQNRIISTDIIYIIMNDNNIIQLADDSQKDTIRKYIK